MGNPIQPYSSVFINCPFDTEYLGLFRPLVFTVLSLGLTPRFALERADFAELRLNKIIDLIRQSHFGIHDLSRCKASRKGEFYRLNMPLELGYDLGAKAYGGKRFTDKKILILEETPHSVRAAASDLAGCDGRAHNGRPEIMVKVVRDWLVLEAGTPEIAAAHIWSVFTTGFEKCNYDDLVAKSLSTDHIDDMEMPELAKRMAKWLTEAKPF